MDIPEHPTLIRRMLDARLKRLATDKPVLAASLVQIAKHCGRPGCHCRQGGPRHVGHYLTSKVQGKTRTVYVPLDLLDDVRSWVEEHKRLRALLAEISQLTLALVKGHVRHQKRKDGRDESRLFGYRLVLFDATGHLRFHRRHCERCLVRQAGSATLYLYQVLEAKLLGPAGVVVSIGTAFIENPDLPADASAEQFKQDCELKALQRLAPEVKGEYPQLRICMGGDGLYLCGAALALAKASDWRYLLIFKPGRLPSVWEDFQQLLAACPEQKVEVRLPDGTRQVYRWVNGLSYTDTERRTWTFNAIQLEETREGGKTTTWAWGTDLAVSRKAVVEVVTRGGRKRWCIENEGFNLQKNSELNLEHAYSHGEEQLKCFYLLLQIAHLMLQLLEKGSLLRKLAEGEGKTPLGLFGSLKNMARRLLESACNLRWPDEAFSALAAKGMQIRLDSS